MVYTEAINHHSVQEFAQNEEYRRVYNRFRDLVFTMTELQQVGYPTELKRWCSTRSIDISSFQVVLNFILGEQMHKDKELGKYISANTIIEQLWTNSAAPYTLSQIEIICEGLAHILAQKKDNEIHALLHQYQEGCQKDVVAGDFETWLNAIQKLDEQLIQENLIHTFDVNKVASWLAALQETQPTVDFSKTTDVDQAWMNFFLKNPVLVKETVLAVSAFRLNEEDVTARVNCIMKLAACYFYLRRFQGLYPFQIFKYRRYFEPLATLLNLKKDDIIPFTLGDQKDPGYIYRLVLERAYGGKTSPSPHSEPGP